jgi:putative restriction endonuclease
MEDEHITKVDDLALVCANCHRMLHRRRPWLNPADLRNLLIREALNNC